MKTKSVTTQKNVPNGWASIRLRDEIELVSGQHVEEKYCSADSRLTPYLTGPNCFENGKVSKFIFTSQPQKMCLVGDILITVKGSGAGSLAVADNSYCISRQLMAIRSKTAVQKFLQNVLRRNVKYFGSLAGGLIPGISREDILTLSINLPPLPEQKRIVAVLEVWDSYLEKLAGKIEIKKRIKKGLMQQLLTGKKRLKGFFEPWETKPFYKLASVKKGEQLSGDAHSANGKYPHLNGGMSPSGYTDKSNTPTDTIAISEGGNSCGYVQFMTEKYWCGGHCYSVTPIAINNKLLYYALKEAQKRIMSLRVGSGLPNVQKSALIALKLQHPVSDKEQAAIAEILTKADDEIEALEKKKAIIEAQKKYLLNHLITGVIRTPEDLLERVNGRN